MKRIITTLLLGCFALIQAGAWGGRVHAAITYIAEQNLTPKAEKKVREILDGKSLVYYASWMDYYKPEMLVKYVDKDGVAKTRTIPHTFKVTKELTPRHDPPHEGVYTMNRAVELLKDYKNLDDSTRMVSMQILAHLLGDMHSPGHVIYADKRDRGIGKFKVTFRGKETTMHRIWDDQFIDACVPGNSYIDLAYVVCRATTKKEKKALQAGTIEDWAQDIIDCTKDMWDVQEGDVLTYDYVTQYRDLAYSQIEKAGLRLAKLLNELFG